MNDLIPICCLLLAIPDAATARLTRDLSHDVFAVRQAAHNRLAAKTPFPEAWLAAVAAHSPCSEARYRAGRLVYYHREKHAVRLWHGRYPWICHQELTSREVNEYLNRAKALNGEYHGNSSDPCWDWFDWREASRLWAEDQMRANRPPAEVRRILGRMLMEESLWRQKHSPERMN